MVRSCRGIGLEGPARASPSQAAALSESPGESVFKGNLAAPWLQQD